MRAARVANYLAALSAAERASVLQAASLLWGARAAGMGQSKDQEADDRLIKGQWLASVAQRVSSEDLADLMDLARVLDEGARFGRLTDELDL